MTICNLARIPCISVLLCLVYWSWLFFDISTLKSLSSSCSTLDWSFVFSSPRESTMDPPGIQTSQRRLSVRPSDVENTSQMKHPTTSQWNVAKTSQWCVSTTSHWNVIMMSQKDVTTMPHHCVSTTSQASLKWNTQWRLYGTLPRRLSGTYPRRPIGTSLRRLL